MSSGEADGDERPKVKGLEPLLVQQEGLDQVDLHHGHELGLSVGVLQERGEGLLCGGGLGSEDDLGKLSCLGVDVEEYLSELGEVEGELEAKLHVVSGVLLYPGVTLLVQELGLLSLDAVIVGGQQVASGRS